MREESVGKCFEDWFYDGRCRFTQIILYIVECVNQENQKHEFSIIKRVNKLRRSKIPIDAGRM